MNIFYLDSDVTACAYYHNDKHVVKMILETCQILAAVHHRYGNHNVTYKETHKNHPSTRWAGDSNTQYYWLHALGMALCKEYTSRYGKVHKCQQYLEGELFKLPDGLPLNDVWTPPPQCMNDEYKDPDTIKAYQNYYRGAKAYMSKWKHGDVPPFMR